MKNLQERIEKNKYMRKDDKGILNYIVNYLKELGILSIILITISIGMATAGIIIIIKFVIIADIRMNDFSSIGSDVTAPFLSFSSVLLVIATLLNQNKKSTEQRQISNVERFESTFFNLISFNNEIVTSIKYSRYADSELSGREYFNTAFNCLRDMYNRNKPIILISDANGFNKILQYTNKKYELFYGAHQEYVGHYFRNLYHIIKFIDNQENLSNNDKSYYVSLVRAQLSTYELLLIFYNSLSKYGCEKFLPLIIRYDLLQNMNQDLLFEESLYTEIINNYDKYFSSESTI